MKLLIVTTNYFPYDGACSNLLNNLLFVGNLTKEFDKIDVLCSKKLSDDADVESLNGITIHRVLTLSLLNHQEFKKAIRKNKFNFISGYFYKIYNRLVRKTLKIGFIDNSICSSFLKALKNINAENYDVVMSVSGRYDCSKAVLKFLKNREQEFVLYQVDPCKSNYTFSKRTLRTRTKLEFELYKRANHIITTPIIYKEHEADEFSAYLNKTIELEFPVVIADSKKKSKSKSISCMFLGSIYGGARDPKFALKLFKKVIGNNIQLHLVGVEQKSLPEEFQTENIICYGRKDLNTSKELMKSADFLVNIGNLVLNQVPSKVFDYISTGKPIINICESSNCPTLKYMDKYPECINIVKNAEDFDIQCKKLKAFLLKEHNLLTNKEINELFYECTPEFCAKKMVDEIK